MDWKETVTVMSENIFPGLSHKIDNKLIGNEVLSNLPLQMSMYFNLVFGIVWFIVINLFLYDKINCFSELNRFIVITVVLLLYLIEVLRLYLGYEGNLRDKIPELAGFWMLSVLLQFPLQSFLLFNPYFQLRILERVVQSIMFTLLTAQLFAGYFTLKNTAKTQTTYFRIMNCNNYTVKSRKKYKTT